MELNGKVAIVTGGGNGIGRGIALELAERGANIVLGEIDVDSSVQVAQEIKAAGQDAIAVATDVTQQASTDSLVEAAIERFGTVDILVNNAGVGGAPGWWERAESSSEDWDAAFEVNVFGIVHCTKSVEEHMCSQKSGKIVNIASVAGRIGAGGIAHYSASKAAAINVSQAYAIRLAPSNVNVNTVCPRVALDRPLGEAGSSAQGDTSERKDAIRSGRVSETACRNDAYEQGANTAGHRQSNGVPRVGSGPKHHGSGHQRNRRLG